MMLKHYFILGFCFVVARGLIAQTPVITPMHTKAHGIVLGLGYSPNRLNSFVSYSPIKNTAVLFQSVESNIFFTDRNSFNRSLKLSVGYCNELIPKLILELYGGISYFKYNYHSQYNLGQFDSHVLGGYSFAYFFQPSIGYKANNFQISLASRFSNRMFESKNANNSNVSFLGDEVIVEPSVNIAWGTEKLKFHFQMGLWLYGIQTHYAYVPFHAQMGFQLQLNALNFKRKKE